MSLPIFDDLTMLAATVWGEARGESFDGRLAVAWVVINRSKLSGLSITEVVLQPYQFSMWNTSDPNRRKIARINPNDDSWYQAYRAAAAAFFNLRDDPTQGATHYLNPRVLPRLPSWYDPAKVVARIGNHEFLRL